MKRAVVFGTFFLCLSCGLTGCGLFGSEPSVASTPASDQAARAARATIDEALQRASAVGAATITPPPPAPPPTDTAAAIPTDTATPDSAATATRLAQEVNAAVAATQSAQAAETTVARQIATAAAETLTAQAPPTNTPTPRPTPTSPRPTPTQPALRLAFAYGSVGDSDIGVLDVVTGGAWLVADRSCDEAEPGWSPDGRFVHYQADCDGRFDLYRVDVEGETTQQLTFTRDQDEREPDVSPDGQWIAYRVNREEDSRNVDGELWVMDSDGAVSQPLGVSGRSPAWSPDGARLLFMSQRDGGWDVYTYHLNGDDIQRLTDCSVNCRFPAWSPDGQSIIYHETTGQETADAESLWVISADGDRARLLVSGDGPGRAVWSDAGLIAFNSQKGVEVVDERGRQRTVLLAGDQHWAPAWSR